MKYLSRKPPIQIGLESLKCIVTGRPALQRIQLSSVSEGARLGFSIAVMIAVLVGCSSHPGRIASPERSCEINLGFVARGLAEYQQHHGHCPHIYLGPNGHQHSWRILIAPYVVAHYDAGKEILQAFEYRFDQPWDSPQNREAMRCLPCDTLHTREQNCQMLLQTPSSSVIKR
jgi:hypothetical protein